MTAKKFEILVLNQISQIGLKRFPAEAYRIVKDAAHPDAILVRSHEMHSMAIAESVVSIEWYSGFRWVSSWMRRLAACTAWRKAGSMRVLFEGE